MTPIRRVFFSIWWLGETGGMEQHLVSLACALVRGGTEVVVFSQMPVRHANAYAQQLRAAGVRLVAPPAWLASLAGSRRSVRRVVRLALLPAVLLSALMRRLATRGRAGSAREDLGDLASSDPSRVLHRRLLDREHSIRRADLIHVHGFRLEHAWVLRWARERSLPSVYTEHATLSDWDGPLRAEDPAALIDAGAIACVAERGRRDLAPLLPAGHPVDLVSHIVPGPDAPPSGSGGANPPGPLRVVCLARLREEKGIDVLLRAFARALSSAPRIELVVAGDGPQRGALERLAAELDLGKRVSFPGQVERESLALILGEADLVALPSLTEGLPLVLLEAMAFARPIVATSVGGIPEVLRDGVSGLLVPAADPDALAAALVRLAADPGLRQRLGAGARDAWQRGGFDESSGRAATLELYGRAQTRSASAATSTVPCGC